MLFLKTVYNSACYGDMYALIASRYKHADLCYPVSLADVYVSVCVGLGEQINVGHLSVPQAL